MDFANQLILVIGVIWLIASRREKRSKVRRQERERELALRNREASQYLNPRPHKGPFGDRVPDQHSPTIGSQSELDAPVREDRLHLLSRVFGLREADCRALHFDGQFFHLSGGPYSLGEISRVTVQGSHAVETRSSGFPSRQTWRHSRKDGQRDRRFANNASSYRSTRIDLAFEVNGNVVNHAVFTDGYGDTVGHDVARKFNVLFSVAGQEILEESFIEYQPLFESYSRLESEARQISSRQWEVEHTTDGLARVGGTRTGLSPQGEALKRELGAEAARLASAVSALEQRRLDVGQEMAAIATRLLERVVLVEGTVV